jgi:lysyl-tRNA synthetase class 2
LSPDSGYKIRVITEKQRIRDRFLKTDWVNYPSVRDLKLAGRLVKVDKTSLTLFVAGKTQKSSFKRVLKKAVKNWLQLESILVAGDIVGVRKNGQAVLLTPFLGSDGAQYTADHAHRIYRQAQRQYDWNRFLSGVNQFFTKKGFLSVETPTLVDNPGPEPTIDVFKTSYKQGRHVSDKFLITSPELHLKKIVSQALSPVYEITKVFRNNEHSPKHKPEFWMIEWYRPFSDLSDICADVKELILFLKRYLGIKGKKPVFENTSFEQILKKMYRYQFAPTTDAGELRAWLKEQNIYFSDSMTLDDLFTLVNLEMIETNIDPNRVVFLNQYPPYAAALAKLDEKGWAQRFEVYWQGLELGNAFNELNDPDIQEQRLVEDNLKKKSNGLESLPIDREFLESLKQGLPPTAGISVGLERLFMALYQEPDIAKLKWF